MYANAQSVESTLGGGDHGHLGLLMPTAEYVLISTDGEEYIEQNKPKVPRLSANQTTRDQQKEEHKDAMASYQEKRTLQTQLLKLLMDAVPEIYIMSLKHSTLGFASTKPQAILKHLIERYGTISAKDIEDNMAKLKAPWNPDTPIDTVFAIGEECRRFAKDADDAISDKAYLRILIATFRNSGVLDKAVEDWHLKQDGKTIKAAIAHFSAADEFRLESKTYLKDILAANPAIASQPPPHTTPELPPDGTLAGWYYCWTHGVTNHTGPTCNYKAEGHIDTATLKNRQGGALKVTPGRYRDEAVSGRGCGRGRGGRGRGRSREQERKRKAGDQTGTTPDL
jgi:hypothetical protein